MRSDVKKSEVATLIWNQPR